MRLHSVRQVGYSRRGQITSSDARLLASDEPIDQAVNPRDCSDTNGDLPISEDPTQPIHQTPEESQESELDGEDGRPR